MKKRGWFVYPTCEDTGELQKAMDGRGHTPVDLFPLVGIRAQTVRNLLSGHQHYCYSHTWDKLKEYIGG